MNIGARVLSGIGPGRQPPTARRLPRGPERGAPLDALAQRSALPRARPRRHVRGRRRGVGDEALDRRRDRGRLAARRRGCNQLDPRLGWAAPAVPAHGENLIRDVIPVLTNDAVLAAVDARDGDRAHPGGVRAPRARRVGDAGEGLSRQLAARRLPRDAGAGRRVGAAEVGDLVPAQPGARAAGRRRRGRCSPMRPPGSCARSSTAGAVTWLRTGAAAAVSAQVLAPRGAAGGRDHRLRRQRRVGGSVPAGGRVRPGRLRGCAPEAVARALAEELGWRVGARADAASAGRGGHDDPRRRTGGRGLGAAPGPAPRGARRRRASARPRSRPPRSARCRLFCDEWEQASSGGELAGAVAAGTVAPRRRHAARRRSDRARPRGGAPPSR